MKPKYHYEEMIHGNFWFYIGWKSEDAEKHIKKSFSGDYGTFNGKVGRTFIWQDNHHTVIIIWTKRKPKDVESIATLAHECCHAANFALDHIGHKHSYENDELHAHLVSQLMRKAMAT